MTNKTKRADVPLHLLEAVIAGDMSQREAGRQSGVSNHTIAAAVRRHLSGTTANQNAAPAPAPAAAADKFEGLGYDAERAEKTPAQAWAEHSQAFEHKLARNLRAQAHVIVRPDASAYAIYHATDVHLDDDSTPLRLLEEDIRASHGMAAIMVHGGDALNNWPAGGRLASKYGDQSCTIPDAILRLEHYIALLRPDVWVDGNHEEFASHMPFLIDRMLPASTITGYWTCDVTVRSKGGRDLRMAVSHKFQKGSSSFHKLHGHIKEMLESQERDLLLDGHLHSSGVLEHTLPERQHTALCVASAGYKVMDSYAARISRGGIVPKLKGRAHWIVVDPQAEPDGTFCSAFTDPRQAEAFLNGLANLRSV